MADESTVSGGVNVKSEKVDVGQDVVGRDKIVGNTTIYHYPGADFISSRRAELPGRKPFFGREAELEQVAAALRPTTRMWGVLIDGTGGIGKTSLALEAAYMAAGFDTRIYLSAKQRELTPGGERSRADFALTNYLSILNELAHALGEGDIAKQPEGDRPRAVRRALENRKALIVLDNLEVFDKTERDRVFQFLDELPGSCKAIVTSRRRDDTGARSIRLGQLSPDAALQLIETLAENNGWLNRTSLADRRRLIEAAGGNPLLVQWIAGQLGHAKSRCRTIGEAIAYLKAAPPGNDPLDYIFGDLRQTFTEGETAVLAVLSHYADLVLLPTIAALAEASEASAEMALEALKARSLVLSDAEALRFALLPLTATYARRYLPPDRLARAADRLCDRAYTLARENGYQNFERFPTLDAEWPTIAAAIPLFLQGDNDRLQGLCGALVDFLNFTGRWDEWLSLSLRAEEKAVAAQDVYHAVWQAYQAARVYYRHDQSAEVLACAARAEQHWAKADARERAFSIRLRGTGHRLAKDYPAAIAAYKEAVSLWRALSPESEDVTRGLNSLAEAERMSDDHAAAECDYREALRIAKKIDDREGVAIYTGNLAELALDQEQWAEAEQLAREALSLSESIGRLELIASNCRRIAQACARQGRKAEGLPYAQWAVDIYTKLRSPDLARVQAVLKECENASIGTVSIGGGGGSEKK